MSRGSAARWVGLVLGLVLLGAPAAHAADLVEKIVLVRHGEKPAAGLGQLDCQGLNRALALPPVIARMFGKPDAIFAPAPSVQKTDDGEPYDYVRPLATIEPTAIAFGLPVHAGIGVSDRKGLAQALTQPAYQNAFVLVAWEHKIAEKVAKDLIADHGGDPDAVPNWRGDDFDSIYVVTITRSGDAVKPAFEHAGEGLDGRPTTCP